MNPIAAIIAQPGGLSVHVAADSHLGGLFLSVALIYLLAYRTVLTATPDDKYETVAGGLRALAVPLAMTFFAIVLLESVRILI